MRWAWQWCVSSLKVFLPHRCVDATARLDAIKHRTTVTTRRETDFAKGLDDLLLQSSRRGVLITISDYLLTDLEPVLAGFRMFRARGWEVISFI